MSMETDSPVVYHGTGESRFPKEEIEKVVTNLSIEEREILRQCNKESLYYRCLPLSVTGMAAVYIAARKGMIKSHPVWGPSFKMTGAAFLGWIVGKLSYRKQCEEKFIHLRNSSIGEMIRKQRGIVLESSQSDFSTSQFDDELKMTDDSSFSYNSRGDYHSSIGSLNLDTDKNIQHSGLDDRERPTTDRDPMLTSQEPEPSRMFTTYEDLRRRNRDDYAKVSAVKSEQNPLGGQRPWSNVDSSPPIRYASNFNEGESKRTESNVWDNNKV